MTAVPVLPYPPRIPFPTPPVSLGEVRAARRVQIRLLDSRPAEPGGRIEWAGHSRPASGLGGDFFDVLPLPDGRLVLAIGDASGKGLPAALIATAVLAALRTSYAAPGLDLTERIAALNRLLYDGTAAEHYATVVLAECDASRSVLRYANCGHVPPLVLRARGPEERAPSTGPPLGLFDAWDGGTGSLSLNEGDALLLVTDGITEALDRDDGPSWVSRLLDLVGRYREAPVADLARATVDAARRHGAGRTLDDATALVVRRRGVLRTGG